MYHVGSADFAEEMPVWVHGADGKIRNERPSIYHRKAVEKVHKHGAKSRIGYLVRNHYGDIKPMTFKQAERLVDLFARGLLDIVDWWVVPHVPEEYGLTGYDTEGELGGKIYELDPYHTNSEVA